MARIKHSKGDTFHDTDGRSYIIKEMIHEGFFSDVYHASEALGDTKLQVILKKFSMDHSIGTEEAWNRQIAYESKLNEEIEASGFQNALTISYTVKSVESGQIYGVMKNLRKGLTLYDYAGTKHYQEMPLLNRVYLARQMVTLVDHFHQKCQMIHGDIQPFNIFVRNIEDSDRNVELLLLDFGMTRRMNREEKPIFQGYTPGYSENYDAIEKTEGKDDWASVLNCIWFCLTGKSKTDYEINEDHIAQLLRKLSHYEEENGFRNFGDEEHNEFIKTRRKNYELGQNRMNELFSNLHPTKAELADKLTELQTILESNGINKNQLFLRIKDEFEALKKEKFPKLDILTDILPNVKYDMPDYDIYVYRSGNMAPEKLKNIMDREQGCLFMIGDGGMGKTTSLLKIMEDTYREGQYKTHPVAFMELYSLPQDYHQWYDEELGGVFIEQFFASYLSNMPRRLADIKSPYIEALHNELFRKPKDGKKEYIILLDGLNEIGFHLQRGRTFFFKALNSYIKNARNLQIILTGRMDSFELTSQGVLRLWAKGLSDTDITRILNNAVDQNRITGTDFQRILKNKENMRSNEARLWQCLHIPFFMMMYCMMSEHLAIANQGEILHQFFNELRSEMNGNTIYSQKAQGLQKYSRQTYGIVDNLGMEMVLRVALDFILPQIALGMVSENTFIIDAIKMVGLFSDWFDEQKEYKTFRAWRTEHYAYSDRDPQDILLQLRQADNAAGIPYLVCDVLGIMRKSVNGFYYFTHQYFRDYFAAKGVINNLYQLIERNDRDKKNLLLPDSEEFTRIMHPFQELRLSPYIAALVGEILKVRKTLPEYGPEKIRWISPHQWSINRDILHNYLNYYRKQPGMGWNEYAKRGLSNLIEIFKCNLIQSDGRIDFSNMNLENLDFTDISLNNVIFSRFDFDGNLAFHANFEGNKTIIGALLRSQHIQKSKCCAVHPLQKRMIVQEEYKGQLVELDLEHQEIRSIADCMKQGAYCFYLSDDAIAVVEDVENLDTEKTKAENTSLIDRAMNFFKTQYIEDEFEDWKGDYDFTEDDEKIKSESPENRKPGLYLHYFYKSLPDQMYIETEGGKFLKASWSFAEQILDVFILTDTGILKLYQFNMSPEPIYAQDKEKHNWLLDQMIYDFPLSRADTGKVSADTLLFCRLSQKALLIGDKQLWKGSIGKWTPAENKLETAIYADEIKEEDTLNAICQNLESGNIYFLMNENTVVKLGKKKMIGGKIRLTDGIYANPQHRINTLTDTGNILCFFKNTLGLYDPATKEFLWKSDKNVESYYLGNGFIMINCENGIFELNPNDGSIKCIQGFDVDPPYYILGKTDSDSAVAVYENGGILKWIKTENGCCFRHTVLQMPEKISEFELYVNDTSHKIFGMVKNQVYQWNNVSGELEKKYAIPSPKNAKFLDAEFVGIHKLVLVYFERRNYKKFPAEKKYFCRVWNISKNKWEKIKLFKGLKKVYDFPFRVFWNTSAQKYAIRILDGNSNVHIDMNQEGNAELRHITRIAEADNVLGVLPNGVLHTVTGKPRNTDLRCVTPTDTEKFEIKCIRDRKIKKSFVTGNILVIHLLPNEKETEEILFWPVSGEGVYYHELAQRNLAIAGCELEYAQFSRLLSMQGAAKAKAHLRGKSIER